MALNEARLAALRGVKDFGRLGSAEELQRILQEEQLAKEPAIDEVPGVGYENEEEDIPLEEEVLLEEGVPLEGEEEADVLDPGIEGELTPEELAELERLLELEAGG